MTPRRPPSNHDEVVDRTPLEVFEALYRRQRDPWGYESRADERVKYERTLAALGERPYARALELGSSIGIFTAMLAERCARVVAVEPSITALGVARERLQAHSGVELVQGAIPEGLPDERFDLVICSEVLYYLSEPMLLATLAAIEARLAPGGSMVAVHYMFPRGSRRLTRLLSARRGGPRPPAPLSGQRVHELLRSRSRLSHSFEERHRTYLLDRFDDRR